MVRGPPPDRGSGGGGQQRRGRPPPSPGTKKKEKNEKKKKKKKGKKKKKKRSVASSLVKTAVHGRLFPTGADLGRPGRAGVAFKRCRWPSGSESPADGRRFTAGLRSPAASHLPERERAAGAYLQRRSAQRDTVTHPALAVGRWPGPRARTWGCDLSTVRALNPTTPP